MDRTWYEHFFTGTFVDLWRQAVPPELTRLEANFLERDLKLQPGQRVLDVPCGHGRHSLELARRGYRMTGVDLSREMLDIAKRSAAEAGAEIEFRLADMREPGGHGEFDAAFCFGNSFGYLDREGMCAFLAAVSRALKSGARFALEYGLAAECILPRFTRQEWAPMGDLYFLEANRYDVAESCIETTYTVIHGGTVETRVGLHWVYTVGEVRAMLRDAGFTSCALYQSPEGQPFELGAPVLIAVAEKQ